MSDPGSAPRGTGRSRACANPPIVPSAWSVRRPRCGPWRRPPVWTLQRTRVWFVGRPATAKRRRDCPRDQSQPRRRNPGSDSAGRVEEVYAVRTPRYRRIVPSGVGRVHPTLVVETAGQRKEKEHVERRRQRQGRWWQGRRRRRETGERAEQDRKPLGW
jgi:hypothetical protein